MSSSRVQKSTKNVFYGLVTQFLTIALNFIARVKFVSVLGIAANGLNGLFYEVIAMLSLAELGVGTAITYSLYQPLAQGDEKHISQIMWLFRTAYHIIAAIILVAGLLLTPFVHLIVRETDFSLSYIRRIFVLFLLRTVSTYLMSYKTSLLTADQKTYVVSLANMLSKTLCTVFCIISLYVSASFEAYLIVIILFNLFTNVAISIYSRRYYPYIRRSDRLPRNECKEILTNIRHIFVMKLSGKITNSTDNILTSILVNTIATGVYSNYSLIITNIKNLFNQVMSSITGSFGNLMATESDEHCERTIRNLFFLFFAFGLVLGGGLISASEPFISLFFGGEYLLDPLTLFVCSYNLFVAIWVMPLWHIVSVSGLFKLDKYIGIAGSTINLIVSVILGRMLGMAGIFIGTTCTYLVQVYLKLRLLYRDRLHMPSARCILSVAWMFLLTFGVLLLERRICCLRIGGSDLLSFLLSGVASVVVSAAVILLLYGRSREFKYFLNLLKKGRRRGA